MTGSFRDLKRNSTSNLEKLNKELSKLNQTFSKDERLWSCQTDKAGNGYAIIRFLPAPQGEDVPFVRMFTHGFQGAGGWYIENSLTTIGKQDPISELNTRLWNSGVDADKETVRKQKRQLNYYSNIYVVKDTANPSNEGKVFLFRYGKKIFDKLNDLMNPQYDDETPVNPFDLWEGANFRLKIRRVEGYANYDKSDFEEAGPLFDDDDKLEEIWKSEYSLQEIIDPKNFKSYEELEKQLNRALGKTSSRPASQSNNNDEDDSAPWQSEPTQKADYGTDLPEDNTNTYDSDDDDDALAEFRRIAMED